MAACPTCGKDLTWIPQYDRFYCYAEKKYAPKGYGTTPPATGAIQLGEPGSDSHVGHYHCPSCGGELSYITQYDRHYCYAEKKYAPKDLAPISLEPVAAAAASPAGTSQPTAAEAGGAGGPTPSETKVSAEVGPAPTEAAASALSPEPAPTVIQDKATVEPEARARGESAVSPESTLPPSGEIPAAFTETATAPGATPEAEDKSRRPALKRSRVRAARKPQLEEWSRAYGLSTKGSRETLRNRLLKYMDDQHLADREEVTIVEAPVPTETPLEPVAAQEPPVEAPMAKTPESERFPSPEPEPVPEVAPTAPDAEPVEPLASPEPEPAQAVPTPEPAVSPTAEREPEPGLRLSPTTEAETFTEEPPTPSTPPTESETAATEPEIRPASVPEPTTERIPEMSYEPTSSVRVVEASTKPTPREATPSLTVEPLPPTPATAPAAKPAEVPVARVEVTRALACPNCGRELTYISRYDRLYCFSCGRYAPKGYGRDGTPVEAPRPPSLAPAAALAPTVQVPRSVEVAKVTETRPENVCPTCGRTMRYVKEYQRWWCDAERKYAPRRVKNPCPTCGKELSYVRTYERWYCTYEKKYAPKSYQAAIPVTVERVTAPATSVEVAQAKLTRAAAAVAAAPATAAVALPAHVHRTPLVGVVLAVVGYSLLVVQTVVFVILPAAGIPVVVGDLNTTLLVIGLVQLVGLLLAMVGTAVGLLSLRSRTG